MRKDLKDEDVLQHLCKLRRAGRKFVRAGEVARAFSVDSVRALGAMLRVQKKLYRLLPCLLLGLGVILLTSCGFTQFNPANWEDNPVRKPTPKS